MDSIYKQNGLKTKSMASVFSYFLALHNEGEIYFNPLYQREYVWSAEDAQALLFEIFNNRSIGSLAVVYNPNQAPEKFCEVVDGRQRLTTLFMFIENKFPYITEEGKKVFFRDLNRMDQSEFKKTKLPHNELLAGPNETVSDLQKVEYFNTVNFGGVPQSEEHKQAIRTLLTQLENNEC